MNKNRNYLIDYINKKTGIPKSKAKRALHAFLETVQAELVKQKNIPDYNIMINLIEAEIQRIAGEAEKYPQISTKVAWWLYCHCPGMIIPARTCYWQLKRLFDLK